MSGRGRFVTVLALLALAATSAFGEEEERGLILYQGEETVEAPVLGSFIHLEVTGMVARAQVTQIFENPSEDTVEAVYHFPLPENAAVDVLRIRIGDRVVEGEVRKREEAAQAYRQALDEGRKAALVTSSRPNVFSTRAGNVGPRETVEVEIGMSFEVRYDLGVFELRFPLVVAERYAAGGDPMPSLVVDPERGPDAAFRVDLDPGFPLQSVTSPGHELRVSSSGRRYTIELAEEVVEADRDFVLEWVPVPDAAPRAATWVEERDGERYVLLMVLPGDASALAAERLSREVVFVIDTSGSMAGSKLRQAKRALRLALKALQPGDRFNVIRFSDRAKAVFHRSRDVDRLSLGRARHFVRFLGANGGTEMLAPLALSLRAPESPLPVRQVVFITDGQASNEEELFQEIGRSLGETRLFTVGIGAAPNSYFLREAATRGRGTYTFVDSDDVEREMGALLAKLEAPVLHDIEVFWDDPAAESWPARPGDLYLGEPLVVAARLRGDGGVRIVGQRRGTAWEAVPELPSLAAAQRAPGIGKLWARRKIDAILAAASQEAAAVQGGGGYAPAGAVDETEAEITSLALEHQLVTAYTSLVAADHLVTAEPGAVPVTRTVPIFPVDVGLPTDGDLIEECITVTSEAPLIDPRQINVGATVSEDLPTVPSAHDPWTLVGLNPGVEVDRTSAVGPGSTGESTVVRVDGVAFEELADVSLPLGLHSGEIEETEVTTAGTGVERETGGLTLSVVTRRGGNEARSDVHVLQGGADAAPGRDREAPKVDHGGSVSGPVTRDRLWAWGSYGHREDEGRALDGDRRELLSDSSVVRLDAQAGSRAAFHLSRHGVDTTEDGWASGPERAGEAALDLAAQRDLWLFQGTFVVSANLYFDASAASNDASRGLFASGGEPFWDADGVLHGGDRGEDRDHRERRAELGGEHFFDFGASHELDFGVASHDLDDTLVRLGPQALRIDGTNLGVPGATFLESGFAGASATRRRVRSVWVQDTLDTQRVAAILGLRWDDASGDAGGPVLRFRTLQPRLGLTVKLGDYSETVLRFAASRFAERLTSSTLQPFAFGSALYREDGGGNSLVTSDGLLRPHVVDPDLEPTLDDELLAVVEHSFAQTFLVGLDLVHRRRSGIAEARRLVDDAAGLLRTATADDYAIDHFVEGLLPTGEAYSVPVYSLVPGLADGGANLLVTGDREVEYEGVTLRLMKRFRWTGFGRWAARAHVHYGESAWRLGPGFLAHRDPTNLLGTGDDDGAPYVEAPADPDLGTGGWVESRWTAGLEGLFEVASDAAWGFDVGFALRFREGNPLPWYVHDLASADGVWRRVEVGTGRLPDTWTLDLRFAKEFELGHDFVLGLGFEALNVLDEDADLRRELNLSGVRGGFPEETVPSRTLRFGVRMAWN